MSLQLAAQHLASKGRGPDTELIHMSKNEIAGLEALANTHGMSLTTNPHTGLPEAGILDSLLPAIVGGVSTYFTGNPYAGMALMGLKGYKEDGLMGGLMGALGAYGGGQLTTGLMGAGQGVVADKALQDSLAENIMKENMTETAAREAATVAAKEAVANTAKSDLLMAGAKDVFLPGGGGLASLQTGAGNLGPGALGAMAAAPLISDTLIQKNTLQPNIAAKQNEGFGQRYRFNPGVAKPFPQTDPTGREQTYFPGMGYTKITNDEAKALYGFAQGGDIQGDPNMMDMPTYEPVVRMAEGGMRAPQHQPYSWDKRDMQKPKGLRDFAGLSDTKGLYAAGGLSDLGSYSDGGRLLKGPGDGVSDSIPATIGGKQPARLADGEFVVPARIVSELGNGSTDAGARQLYKMMDRIQKARGKTTSKGKVAKNTNAAKYLPA